MSGLISRLRRILCAYLCPKCTQKTASSSPFALPTIVIPENCNHPEWTEETRETGFRSHCKQCGIRSEGSCQ